MLKITASFRKKKGHASLPETWLTGGAENRKVQNAELAGRERGPERAGPLGSAEEPGSPSRGCRRAATACPVALVTRAQGTPPAAAGAPGSLA